MAIGAWAEPTGVNVPPAERETGRRCAISVTADIFRKDRDFIRRPPLLRRCQIKPHHRKHGDCRSLSEYCLGYGGMPIDMKCKASDKKWMPRVFSGDDGDFARSIARLNPTNPFLPERIVCEREALGREFDSRGAQWNMLPPDEKQHPNHVRLTARAEEVLERARKVWSSSGRVGAEDARLYEELAGFWLYQRYALKFDAVIRSGLEGGGSGGAMAFYAAFRADAQRVLALPGLHVLETQPIPHLFACAFQIRRAFHHIFRSLVGGSAGRKSVGEG